MAQVERGVGGPGLVPGKACILIVDDTPTNIETLVAQSDRVI